MPVNYAEIANAYLDGKFRYSSWRKVPTQTTTTGLWFDLSMSPGNPVPQYYAATPQVAIALAKSTDGGLDHGASVSPLTKYLHKVLALTTTATAVPLPLYLLDYLMYYPFVPMDVGDTSLTTNISIPRYTNYTGIQIMPVLVAAQSGGTSFYCTYTNQDGISGRVTSTVVCNSATFTGAIVSSNSATANSAGPFLPLQAGDTGVRSIESITNLTGDVGLLSLVLVKPLATINIYDITAPAEKDFLLDDGICPIIKDDAYINFIAHVSGTLAAAPIIGELHTFWS